MYSKFLKQHQHIPHLSRRCTKGRFISLKQYYIFKPNQEYVPLNCMIRLLLHSPLSVAFRFFHSLSRYCVCYTHEEMYRMLQSMRKDAVLLHVDPCNCHCSFCSDENCKRVLTDSMDLHWFMSHMCCESTPKITTSARPFYDWRWNFVRNFFLILYWRLPHESYLSLIISQLLERKLRSLQCPKQSRHHIWLPQKPTVLGEPSHIFWAFGHQRIWPRWNSYHRPQGKMMLFFDVSLSLLLRLPFFRLQNPALSVL